MGSPDRQGDRELSREGHRKECESDAAERSRQARRCPPFGIRYTGASFVEDARKAGAARDAGRGARSAFQFAARAALGKPARLRLAPCASPSGRMQSALWPRVPQTAEGGSPFVRLESL